MPTIVLDIEGDLPQDPEERVDGLVGALLVLAIGSSQSFHLDTCSVLATLAVACIQSMIDHGHGSCAAGVAEDIGVIVAEIERDSDKPTSH